MLKTPVILEVEDGLELSAEDQALLDAYNAKAVRISGRKAEDLVSAKIGRGSFGLTVDGAQPEYFEMSGLLDGFAAGTGAEREPRGVPSFPIHPSERVTKGGIIIPKRCALRGSPCLN